MAETMWCGSDSATCHY